MVFKLLVFLLTTIATLHSFKFSELLTKFTQSDSKIKLEHMDVDRFDPIYIKNLSIKTFKYNRTTTALNITGLFKVDFEEDLDLLVQTYKFLSNEYRHFPVRFRVNFCSVINQNVAGLKYILTQNGNISECPSKKNVVYQITNYIPDQRKFPPNIPSGRYMSETLGLYGDIEVFCIKLYGSVSRPIIIPD